LWEPPELLPPTQPAHFRFQDVPPNPYRLEVSALGFAVYRQDISVRGLVP